jgi:hypothetical protein
VTPRDEAAHHPLELRRLHDAAQVALPLDLLDVPAAEQRGGGAHELLHPEADHLLEHEALPAVAEDAPLLVGDVGRGGEEAGVDGPHRRAADDVELDLSAEVAGEILADIAHHAGLIGAAGTAAGQHESHPGTVAALPRSRRCAHPISSD